MVPILVFATFLAFAVIELIRSRGRDAAMELEGERLHQIMSESEPSFVAGFELPGQLYYHQGHTWVHRVGEQLVFVGLDDFGRRLLGKGVKVSPPAVGTFVHQGDDVITVRRDGEEVRLRVPITGEIVGSNPGLKKDPDLVHRNPYGRGWILKIRCPDLIDDLTNLLSGSMARHWMEDTRARFQRQLMIASGSVIQDGGSLVDDLPRQMDRRQWRVLVDEFLIQR